MAKLVERSIMRVPKVSILIPCYNSRRFIAEAVESAFAQTYTSVEVVVVDDGSTDGSVEALRMFGSRIILEAGPNRGACVARNRAFELSTGDYIQFLDADDRLDHCKVEKQLNVITAEGSDLALCQIGLFGDQRGERPEKRPHPVPVGDMMLYFANFGIQTAAPLVSRELFERSCGFLPGLRRGQEADLHVRMGALNPRISMVDEILVWVRMHDGDRISKTPAEISQVVATLMHQADFIEKYQVWTNERRVWLSTSLMKAARACFACGDRRIAVRGLRRAISVYPKVTQEDRFLRQILGKCLGNVNAEMFINRVRRLFS